MMHLEAALEYHKAGFRVVPFLIKKDETGKNNKYPAVSEWKKYREGQTEDDVRFIFSQPHNAIAILMTDGLETIDIDLQNDGQGSLKEDFVSIIKEDPCINDVVVNKTRSGGYHMVYRTVEPNSNTKLARSFDGEAIIETRGKGGLIIAPPTVGYETVKGDMLNIPYIEYESKQFYFSAAISLDRQPQEEIKTFSDYNPTPAKPGESGRISSFQDYNQKTSPEYMIDLLTQHGWREITGMRTSNHAYLTRPGKSRGVSADYQLDYNLFKVWSTSTEFEPEVAHKPYETLTVLEYRGDFSACARDLYREGYGSRYEEDKEEIVPDTEEHGNVFSKYNIDVFDPEFPPEDIEPCFHYISNVQEYPICGMGSLVMVSGLSGSMKTTLLKGLAASALSFQPHLSFRLDVGNRDIVWFDTEQPPASFYKTGKTILDLIGARSKPDRLHMYSLDRIKKKDRLMVMKEILAEQHDGNIGMLVIDGIADMCMDFNNIEQSSELMEEVTTIRSETGAIVFPVLHTTKTNGWMRGHLGTIADEKGDAVIDVIKADGYSRIVGKKVRAFDPFPEAGIAWKDGRPVVYMADNSFLMGKYKNV